MRFGFVRIGLWRGGLGLVALAGLGLSGVYLWRVASGRGLGWLGWLGVPAVVVLLVISLVVCYLFWVLGAAFAELKDEGVRVKMGRLVDFTIPWGNISGARKGQHRLSEGVGVRYDFNGGLAVVSAAHNIVELELASPQEVKLPLPGAALPVERVKLSLRRPTQFMAEVEETLKAKGLDS